MASYDNIRSKIYLLTKTNVNSLSNANLNLYTQPAEDRIISLIMRADSRWQYDDANYGDLPSATTQINADQQDYSLPTSHLTIERVELKDSGGSWDLLIPMDSKDIRFLALAEGESSRKGAFLAGTGVPLYYDKKARSLILYPVPNYTQAASLAVYFTRGALKFDYTDSKFTDDTGSINSVPGFAELFHNLIPLWASYDYAVANGLRNVNQLMVEIVRLEKELDDFYGLRNRDESPRFTLSTNQTPVRESGRLGLRGGDSNK